MAIFVVKNMKYWSMIFSPKSSYNFSSESEYTATYFDK